MRPFEPIAIVGQACLLPGAHSPEELWRAAAERRDLLTRASAATWQVAAKERLMRPSSDAPAERIPTDRGGYVTGFEARFEPHRYQLPTGTAEKLDPLFQWLLHVGHEAFADAGLQPGAGLKGGAIIGNLSYPTYALNEYAWSVWAEAAGLPARGVRPDAMNRFMSGLPVTVLNRSLGLSAGGFMVDAACASSLYAIKFACDWLQHRRADVMLAGGVSRVHGLTIHAGFTTLQALSATGQSRPLHAQADGLVPSEGAAVVVLKRLTDAQRDGDRVLGVIRGIGLSNDGRGTGLLVPSTAAQVVAMRRAYALAGLDPAGVELLECHATGTLVGDAVEIASCAEVFRDAKRLQLGSLKSNIGHLLPVAGVAGLIKVLKSFEHGALAPIRELGEPNRALAGAPFSPTLELQEWRSERPRLAGVNAFGFGGNNAHLILEQAPSSRSAAVHVGYPEPATSERCAIVALAVRAGSVRDARGLAQALATDGPADVGPITEVRLPFEGSAFPPADLQHALPQQLLALELAHEAARQTSLPRTGVSVFVGMGCDPEACRFGLNLRLAEFLAEHGATAPAADRLPAAREAIIAGPVAATTLGLMPNVVANRINRQFGADAASAAISAEELSGIEALNLAIDALRSGECDAAVVGAVELGADPVHAAARRDAGLDGRSADGACMLVLKRESDARRDGDAILAFVSPDIGSNHSESAEWTTLAVRLSRRFGVAHAAHGLLQLAAAVASVAHRSGEFPARLTVCTRAMGGAERMHALDAAPAPASSTRASVTTASSKTMSFPAHRAAVGDILAKLVAPAAEVMPQPPRLRPVHETPAGTLEDASEPSLVPVAAASVAADNDIVGTDDVVAAAHETFLQEMGAAHAAFLRAMHASESHAPADVAPESGALADAPVVHPERPRFQESAPATASAPAPVAAPAAKAEALPGPKFSRTELERLASGNISELFGASFAGQDGFVRQVRMPMPPMLLADRVTGIDAAPGVLGTGKIWTETDVTPDAWYLDVDRMPLGITIEAGQADLLLVSWMGIDRYNRSERIYRLLGCEATIKGRLPKIGDTLRFEIAVNGHAELGPIRMMFFQSDLRVKDEVVLSVRNGQAGFFSDEELANSEGVLWDAATAKAPAIRERHDGAPVAVDRSSFDAAAVRAFAEGRIADCFGSAFGRTRAHTRSPRIPAGRMQLIDEVTHFDPSGGPWGRGYLRSVKHIAPDLWFFAGHFKNDPCMPGTLMLEGAVQSLAFYLTALGCTLHADGWRFEPVQGQTIGMRCRGQCVPSSRELVYEVFVEEFVAGPVPRVRASVMASVDGLKAFLAEGLALELIPDWPLDQMLRDGELAVSGAGTAWQQDGFVFDHRSLLACALGRPSEAFGPRFSHLDSPTRIPRLPRPPYHFMTRITGCTAIMARPQPGVSATCEYDFDADAWYFAENGAPTMPSCVFMEALLQPCGWLSSFVRDNAGQKDDIFFRNLDGTLTWTREVPRGSGTLRVTTELTRWSELGTMIIVAFKVVAHLDGTPVATMETSFGFFPGDAFANQAGVPPTPLEQQFFAAPSNLAQALRPTAPFPQAGAPLAHGRLMMLDRLTGWWPDAGAAGLGIVRAEKDVDAGEWFFNAHFMQDPVQPGSLGIEALVQLLQCAMRLRGLGADLANPVFEPVALGEPLVWKYRGQVVPENARITTLVELTEIVAEPGGATLARARGSLWVDGKKIYETPALAMRVRAGVASKGATQTGATGGEQTFSLATTPWLTDHRPSFTTAVLPLTSLIDCLAARAVATAGRGVVTSISNFFPSRWVTCADQGTLRLRTTAESAAQAEWTARLAVWREAARQDLSRFDEIGTAVVSVGEHYPAPPSPLPRLEAPERESPYLTGETTHGPAFHVVTELRRSSEGASCLMNAGAGSVPVSLLHPALLDGCTHVVPFSHLHEWYPTVGRQFNGLPRGLHTLRLFGPTPTAGVVRCEVRPRGLDARTGLPLAYAQFIVNETVWCDLVLEFALLDATPFQHASYRDRRAFITEHRFHPAIRFSRAVDDGSELSAAEVARYQWMPRQLETMVGVADSAAPAVLAEAIAGKELLAHELGVHPREVRIDAGVASTDALPIQRVPLVTSVAADTVRIVSRRPVLLPPVADTFFRGAFLDDLIHASAGRFVRYFRLAEPVKAAAIRGRPVIVCSNHQTALESLLFTDLFMRWSGSPLTTVTRIEHQRSWVGQVTDLLWRHPAQSIRIHPQTLFDRDQPGSFIDLLHQFTEAQTGQPHSLHLHVEGEQALRAGQPVARMTSAVIDLALAARLPILPVKFSGGLPQEPLSEIVSLPFAYGRQDYTLGSPLFPEELGSVPRPKAAERVVAAINALAPASDADVPLTPDDDFAARVAVLMAQHRIGEIQAAIVTALRELPRPSPATTAILDFGRDSGLAMIPAHERDWHREFAAWLWRDDAQWQSQLEAWKQTAKH